MSMVGSIASKGRWSFEWTVPDIFSYEKTEEFIESPRLVLPDSEWLLRMYPYGLPAYKTEGGIGLYLVWAKDSLPKRRAKYTFGVKRSEGKIEAKDEQSYEFIELGYGRGYSRFILRSDLVARRDELAPSGALTVTCTLKLGEETDDGKDNRLVQLSEDLKEMFTSGKGSDAAVKVTGETFPVHRGILESRSPVFASMFEADMKEKQTGTVDIEDCDPVAFRDFLLYLYSAKTEELPRNAFRLYRIADKYDVQGLMSECLQYALDNLSCENVIDAVLLAHQFHLEELKEKAQVFFCLNLKSITPTDQWKSFMREHHTVAAELLVNMSERVECKK